MINWIFASSSQDVRGRRDGLAAGLRDKIC